MAKRRRGRGSENVGHRERPREEPAKASGRKHHCPGAHRACRARARVSEKRAAHPPVLLGKVKKLESRKPRHASGSERRIGGRAVRRSLQAVPAPCLAVKAGNEVALARVRRRPETDAARLEPRRRGRDPRDQGACELTQRNAAAHLADRPHEVVLVRGPVRTHQPQPPRTGKEARARERLARACERHARPRLGRGERRLAAGDSRPNDEHVAHVGF